MIKNSQTTASTDKAGEDTVRPVLRTIPLAKPKWDAPDEDELKSLAEDIVAHCPSLTHLLLAIGQPSYRKVMDDLN